MTLNLLIVDDSETVRAVIAKTLGLSGVEIGELHMAANGEEAIDTMDSHWIDLVLTDINMPVMGGIEMIRQMRQNDMLKTIPVIVVSTEGSAKRIEQLKEQGVCAYIRKPFTPEQIRNVVESVIGVREGPSDLEEPQ